VNGFQHEKRTETVIVSQNRALRRIFGHKVRRNEGSSGEIME
jgi:hypothetical protein